LLVVAVVSLSSLPLLSLLASLLVLAWVLPLSSLPADGGGAAAALSHPKRL
jgi:hypothetical protein